MAETEDAIAGYPRTFDLLICDGSGAVLADYYDGTEDASCLVWPGDDLASVVAPAVTWADPFDAANPTVTVAISGADTQTLGPGSFKGLVTVTKDGRPEPVKWFTLAVAQGPGSASGRYSYLTFDQVRAFSPEVDRLFSDSDQANFAEQLAAATAEFDRMVLDRYSPQPGRSRRLVDAAGTASGSYNRFSPGPAGAAAPTRAEVAALLGTAAVCLDADTVECVARLALSYIYLGSPGRDDVYRQTGASEKQRAMEIFRRTFLEIDDSDTPSVPPTPRIRIAQDVTFLT